MVATSGQYDTDCDQFLHNTDPSREPGFKAQALARLALLEKMLDTGPRRGQGPFFLGASAVTAAYAPTPASESRIVAPMAFAVA